MLKIDMYRQILEVFNIFISRAKDLIILNNAKCHFEK
jgi:hypothetical protein